MNWTDIFENELLISALMAWAAAQGIKTILYAIMNRKLDIHRLFGDGGMPSGHSATVTSMAVTAGIEYGLRSSIFGMAAIVAIIVMHDAMGVRREAGKHAKILNELWEALGDPARTEEKLKEFLGHTPLQVVCGAILGFLVAVLRQL